MPREVLRRNYMYTFILRVLVFAIKTSKILFSGVFFHSLKGLSDKPSSKKTRALHLYTEFVKDL